MTWTKRHKFGARATVVDGIRFASKREANRYGVLKLLERGGLISGLERQPVFTLHALGGARIGKYVADFTYFENGARVIEDAKGFKTPMYRWKKKHVEAEYGVTIIEV